MREESAMLGYRVLGSGERHVILLNDWIEDSSSWDPALPLFDGEQFSWAFMDLRGYGRSRALAGAYSISEVAEDVLRTADELGWQQFAIVGHSMSALAVLHLGQVASERLDRIVLICPPPPSGLGADEFDLERLQAAALGGLRNRLEVLGQIFGDRLSDRWRTLKAKRWLEAAEPQAVAGYVRMFARDGLPDQTTPVTKPVLALTGEQDAEIMRSEGVRRSLATICPELTLYPIPCCGHYPMQEVPVLTYTVIERFLEEQLFLEP